MKKLPQEFRDVQAPNLAELESSVAELERNSARTDNPSRQATAAAILETYCVTNEILLTEIRSEIAMLQKLDQVAVQNVVLAQPIGGAALVSGTVNLLAYYKYLDRPRVATKLRFGSAISGRVWHGSGDWSHWIRFCR